MQIIYIADITRQTLLRYFLAAVLIAGGCQEKEEKPEIENPVPEVNDVQTKVLIDVKAAGSDEIKKCESLPFPMYNCIGNHDHDTKATSEAQGHAHVTSNTVRRADTLCAR